MMLLNKYKEKYNNFMYTNRELLLMILLYTITFAIIFLLGFRVFLFEYGKSFIWQLDGVYQHFPFIFDTSQIIKEFISNPQNGISLWSWDMGFGADIIHSYTYYLLGDPLSMAIATFLPVSLLEMGYSWMIALRIYLVGLSLLIYCRHISLKIFPSVVAALIYAFSIHMLFWGLRHPFFINGAYILPILYIGVDKILQHKKPYLFILVVAFSAINNFYFFYMNTIAVFLYAILRTFYLYKGSKKLINNSMKLFIRTILYYSLGIMIGSFLFIPSVYAFLNTSRGLNYDINFKLYGIDYLTSFFRNLFSFSWDQIIEEVTVSVIALPCIIFALFSSKKEYKVYKVLFILFSAFVFFPIFHSMFNGFSTPNNRWMYIYIMVIAILTAITLNIIEKINFGGIFIMGLGFFLYIYGLFSIESLADIYFLIAVIVGVGFLISLFAYRITDSKRKGVRRKRKANKTKVLLLKVFILMLVIFNLSANIHGIMGQKRYGNEFEDYNTVLKDYRDSITSYINGSISDNSFYRVEYNDIRYNRTIVNDFKGSYFFNSIINKNISEFFINNNINTNFYRSGYLGLDNITALEAILGMKYYIVEKGSDYILPYGFEEYATKDNALIYTNPNALPLGFVYYQSINESELSNVNGVYKTQVMLDAVIVEDDEKLDINHYDIQDNTVKLPYTIKRVEGLTMDGQNIEVKEKNAKIVLSLNEEFNGEVYLEINDIYHADEEQSFRVNVERTGVSKFEETKRVSSPYYMENHDYMINLGYDSLNSQDITLEFPVVGNYTISEMSILGVGMDTFDEKIETLKDTQLENIKYSDDYVSGTTTLYDKGILFLSIPYTEGWKVKVDGKRVDTIKVNTGFTGIELGKGTHDIELEYKSPWLNISIAISIIGILIFIGLLIIDKKGGK